MQKSSRNAGEFFLALQDADISITQDTIRSREESYRIVKQQYDRQATNGLVLRQSEAEMGRDAHPASQIDGAEGQG